MPAARRASVALRSPAWFLLGDLLVAPPTLSQSFLAEFRFCAHSPVPTMKREYKRGWGVRSSGGGAFEECLKTLVVLAWALG